MAKKKKQVNQSRNTNIVAGVVIAVVVVALAALVGINAASRHWAVKVDGHGVSEKEYKVYLYLQVMGEMGYYASYFGWDYEYQEGSTFAQQAQQTALATLEQKEVAKKEAAKRGLKLTDEQKEAAKSTRDQFVAALSAKALDYIGLSDGALLRLFEDDALRQVLYDDMTKEYVFDEDDFEMTYLQYLVDNRLSLETHDVAYVLTDTKEQADEAVAKVKAGGDVYDIIKEYSVDYAPPTADENGDIPEDARMSPAPVTNISQLDDNQKLEIYELRVGDVSKVYEIPLTAEYTAEGEDGEEVVVPATNQYIFCVVKNVELPDEETTREEQKSSYIDNKKYEIYEPAFSAIVENIKFETNADMLNTISISTLVE